MRRIPKKVHEELNGFLHWPHRKVAPDDVAAYVKRFRQVELTRDVDILCQAIDQEYGSGVGDSFLGAMEEVQGVLERHNIFPVQDVGWEGVIDLAVEALA